MSPDDDFGGRSFLDFGQAPLRAVATVESDESTQARSYLLTGGRTGGGKAGVKLETMVRTAESARLDLLGAEQRQILDAVRAEAMAVAEVAARVQLPLGVVQVLVGDLVHDEQLVQSTGVVRIHDNIPLLERLIEGVFAL